MGVTESSAEASGLLVSAVAVPVSAAAAAEPGLSS